MKLLDTQDIFEEMWFQGTHQKEAVDQWIVYFTAAWCKPCQALDCERLTRVAMEKGIPIFRCDYTRNEYTPGFCGVNSFPTFMCFSQKKVVSTYKSNRTDDVAKWIDQLM
jgi:thiol-disulfide isomerase/thioredoxin